MIIQIGESSLEKLYFDKLSTTGSARQLKNSKLQFEIIY